MTTAAIAALLSNGIVQRRHPAAGLFQLKAQRLERGEVFTLQRGETVQNIAREWCARIVRGFLDQAIQRVRDGFGLYHFCKGLFGNLARIGFNVIHASPLARKALVTVAMLSRSGSPADNPARAMRSAISCGVSAPSAMKRPSEKHSLLRTILRVP